MLNIEALNKYAPHVELLSHEVRDDKKCGRDIYIHRFSVYDAICEVNHNRVLRVSNDIGDKALATNEESTLLLKIMGLTNTQAAVVARKGPEAIKSQSSAGFNKLDVWGRGAINATTRRMVEQEVIHFEKPISLPEGLSGVNRTTLGYIRDLSLGNTIEQIWNLRNRQSSCDTIKTRVEDFCNDVAIKTHQQAAVFYAIGSGLLPIATISEGQPAVAPPDITYF